MPTKRPVSEADELALILYARAQGWDHERIMLALKLSRPTYWRRVQALKQAAEAAPRRLSSIAS